MFLVIQRSRMWQSVTRLAGEVSFWRQRRRKWSGLGFKYISNQMFVCMCICVVSSRIYLLLSLRLSFTQFRSVFAECQRVLLFRVQSVDRNFFEIILHNRLLCHMQVRCMRGLQRYFLYIHIYINIFPKICLKEILFR